MYKVYWREKDTVFSQASGWEIVNVESAREARERFEADPSNCYKGVYRVRKEYKLKGGCKYVW